MIKRRFSVARIPALVGDEPEDWNLILGLRIIVHFILWSSFSRKSGYDAKRLEGVPEPVHDEMPLFVRVKGKSRK